jgi:hypothetical protein
VDEWIKWIKKCSRTAGCNEGHHRRVSLSAALGENGHRRHDGVLRRRQRVPVDGGEACVRHAVPQEGYAIDESAIDPRVPALVSGGRIARKPDRGRTRRIDLIEQMVVHANETRDHRAPPQIERRCTGWDFDGGGVAESGDATTLDAEERHASRFFLKREPPAAGDR